MKKSTTKGNKASLDKLWYAIRQNRLTTSRIRLTDPVTKEVVTFKEDQPLDFQSIPDKYHFEIMWLKDCLDGNREEFDTYADELLVARLMLSESLYDQMKNNWQQAQKLGVEYSPMKAALKAIKAENAKFEKLKKK